MAKVVNDRHKGPVLRTTLHRRVVWSILLVSLHLCESLAMIIEQKLGDAVSSAQKSDPVRGGGLNTGANRAHTSTHDH